MTKKLDVFLSSSATEFKNERKYLSKKISKIPFLESILLEDRGPKTQNTKSASLKAVKKCDILIGILGDTDSEITRAEIEEAYKEGKYCLIYLKKTRTKNEEMEKFIKEFVMPNLVYDKFKDKKNLYAKITKHLEDHIYEILEHGLECFKKEQQELVKKEKKTETETKKKIKTKNYKAKDVLRDAKQLFRNEEYLSSVIMSGMAVELGLKNWLNKKALVPTYKFEKKSIRELVRMVENKGMSLGRTNEHNMIEIRMMRNQAVHEAKVPSKESAQIAIKWTNNLLKTLGV